MVYTFETFDEDGESVAHGVRDRMQADTRRGQPIAVEVHGKTYGLDPNDLLLRAQGFFEAKYGAERGADFYLRWASVVTLAEENTEELEREGIVKTENGQVVSIKPDFTRMLLASYIPPVLYGSFPTSPLHEGERGFSLPKCLDAWHSQRRF